MKERRGLLFGVGLVCLEAIGVPTGGRERVRSPRR